VYSNRGAAHFRLGKILLYILLCVCLFEALRSAKNNDPENVVARSYAKTLALKPLRLYYESVLYKRTNWCSATIFSGYLSITVLIVFLFIYIVFVIFEYDYSYWHFIAKLVECN